MINVKIKYMYNFFLKKVLKEQEFKNLIESKFCKSSFAQFGEDLIINKLLSKIPYGNFLDLGSFHPIHFSNTLLLYLRGWRGVNVDGNKEMIEIFKKIRPLDINIAKYLSDYEGENYYIFDNKNAAMNRVVNKIDTIDIQKEQSVKIITTTLNNVIKKYEKDLQKLYYLNIDLEYQDYVILKTFDFKKYHPLVISIEIHDFDFDKENEVSKFLIKQNYSMHSYIKPTAIYVDNLFKENNFNLN